MPSNLAGLKPGGISRLLRRTKAIESIKEAFNADVSSNSHYRDLL
jgi:hypothetical protein